MNKSLHTFLIAACGFAAAAVVHAADAPYPAKAVRMIVPFAPGGPTDVIARVVAAKLSEAWNNQVVVDNRAGAGSALGAEIVARSPADGYTLLFGNISLAFNQALYANLGYDAVRDFSPEIGRAHV